MFASGQEKEVTLHLLLMLLLLLKLSLGLRQNGCLRLFGLLGLCNRAICRNCIRITHLCWLALISVMFLAHRME